MARRKRVIRRPQRGNNRGPKRHTKTNLNPVQGSNRHTPNLGVGGGGVSNNGRNPGEGPSHMCNAGGMGGFSHFTLDHGFCWDDNHCYWQCVGDPAGNQTDNTCPWGPSWPCCNAHTSLQTSNCQMTSCTCTYNNPTYWLYKYEDIHYSGMMGDVNQDGSVNILDVMSIVSQIVNGGNVNQLTQYLMDVNQDGNLNVTDVTGMVNCIMGCGNSHGSQSCIQNCLYSLTNR